MLTMKKVSTNIGFCHAASNMYALRHTSSNLILSLVCLLYSSLVFVMSFAVVLTTVANLFIKALYGGSQLD